MDKFRLIYINNFKNIKKKKKKLNKKNICIKYFIFLFEKNKKIQINV